VSANGSEHYTHEELAQRTHDLSERTHEIVRKQVAREGELYMQIGRLVGEIGPLTIAVQGAARLLRQIMPRLAAQENAVRARQASRPDLIDENGHDGEDTKTRLRRERDEHAQKIAALEKDRNDRELLAANAKTKKEESDAKLRRLATIVGIVVGTITVLTFVAAKVLPLILK
jgi:hypothetical protein